MIGKKIKYYRQQFKLTGATLSNLAGINQPYLSQIENEKKYPPFETFINLVSALAKVGPITKENLDEILTEENYEMFKKSDSFKEILQLNPNNDDDDMRSYFFITDNTIPDSNDLLRVFEDKLPNLTDEYLWYIVNDSVGYSANEYVGNESYFDILSDFQFFIQEIPILKPSLYKWWYNHILQDIMMTGIKDNVIYADEEINEIDGAYSPYSANISEADQKLLAEFWPLMDLDGTFTPSNDDSNTNVSKDLLEGKTVSFDLIFYKDKNIRLSLDGKQLSSKEFEMLNVAIGAIRYFRQDK